jgi:hypothetical protein
LTLTTPVRLFVWINLNKLGLEHTTTKSPFVNDLLKIFKVERTANGSRFEVTLSSIETDDITKQQFEKYNYNNFEKLLYYPFMAITLRLNFQVSGDLACYDAVETFENIECKNYAYT